MGHHKLGRLQRRRGGGVAHPRVGDARVKVLLHVAVRALDEIRAANGNLDGSLQVRPMGVISAGIIWVFFSKQTTVMRATLILDRNTNPI